MQVHRSRGEKGIWQHSVWSWPQVQGQKANNVFPSNCNYSVTVGRSNFRVLLCKLDPKVKVKSSNNVFRENSSHLNRWMYQLQILQVRNSHNVEGTRQRCVWNWSQGQGQRWKKRIFTLEYHRLQSSYTRFFLRKK